ncbi:MAG: beta-ketoacyl-ACP synthase III [Verrucomicrobia bacterium]|jgi:3-oxoacyl-[acyl-carrier-protein] synthase-3|nr:beta-ketoacyl-ACP synthase III [Verrucomicrobiota bacterium]
MSQSLPSVIISGTGTYLPHRVVSNDDMAQIVETSDEWIRSRTGIAERRYASEKESTSYMATHAAKQAMKAAGTRTDEIDLLIVATMTPDMPFPSTACLVQSQLGLDHITAFDIQAACSGYIYALNTAANLLRSGAYNKALIIGAEKMSSILDFEDRTTCVLFGDGASAAVLECSEAMGLGILSSITGSDGSNPQLLYQPAGGSACPATTESVLARQHFIKMNGREIFKQAVRVMGQVSVDILERHGYSTDQVDLLIPHQANMRIIDSLAKRMRLPMERFHNNLEYYGNTSAASIGIALHEAHRSDRIRSGDLILLVAFGAGLTWGSTLIKWH